MRSATVRNLLFVARGFNSFEAQVVPTLTGRDGYDKLKKAGVIARAVLIRCDFPCPRSTSLATP